MRVFEHPNFGNGVKCPVCHTQADKPVVLIPIHGTGDGSIIEARQYHLDCLDDLREMEIGGMTYVIQQVGPAPKQPEGDQHDGD